LAILHHIQTTLSTPPVFLWGQACIHALFSRAQACIAALGIFSGELMNAAKQGPVKKSARMQA
jgi:hypothetical protein